MVDENVVREMETYYAKRAPNYDNSMGYDLPDTLERYDPIIEAVRRFALNRKILEIACGPGFWTQVMAPHALDITATDLNETTLLEARKKSWPEGKVEFFRTNAYTLKGVSGTFDAAFSFDWWSHIPRSRVSRFLEVLHSRLRPGAQVLFIDSLPWEGLKLRLDSEGNNIQTRKTREGDHFEIIKNFWTDEEIREQFEPLGIQPEARPVSFISRKGVACERWAMSYGLP